MAVVMVLALSFGFLLSSKIHGASIIGQPRYNHIILRGHSLTLPFNYSLGSDETNRLFTIALALNRTEVFSYAARNGNVLDETLRDQFQGRPDIQVLRSPQSYVGIYIPRTQWSDSGEYIWSITIGINRTTANPIRVIIGSEPKEAKLIITKKESLTYELECQITGAIPLPNITIYNGTEVLQAAPSIVSTSVTINVTLPSEYSCNGTNALGSVGISKEIVTEDTTESPTTTPLTSSTTGGDTAVTATNMPGKTSIGPKTGDGSNLQDDPTTPTGLIVGVAVGVVCLIVVIGSIVYVCVFKLKAHRTDPDKERVAATTENQCSETPMNDTKCQQEQEEKQQRNVEGLQYADLDLRPTGKTKPAGGRNNLVIDEDSKTEYAEVRKA